MLLPYLADAAALCYPSLPASAAMALVGVYLVQTNVLALVYSGAGKALVGAC